MKRILNTLAAATALTATLSHGVQAQDALAWQGFHAGLQVSSVDPDITGSSIDADRAGGYGLFAGYDHALGDNWVVGGELSYGRSGDHTVSPAVGIALENAITLSARAGYAFGGTLVYGRLGFQQMDVTPTTGAIDWTAEGAVFGLGVEQMLSENISARLEYTRSDLDLSGTGVPAGVGLSNDSVSLGIAYRF